VSETSFRGGAQVGWVNASWPFATLSVSTSRLALACLGTYEFGPAQVVSVEPCGTIPLLASGIRINHNRADYPEKIIFWCAGGRDRVLTELLQKGFFPSGDTVQRAAGFPVRWSVIIAVIALWNVFFMLDSWWQAESGTHVPGGFSLSALLALFGLVTAVRAFPGAQRVVLREGHEIGEIKGFLGLLQLVSGLMSVVFGAMWLARAYVG
jgi:hypothetical protein